MDLLILAGFGREVATIICFSCKNLNLISHFEFCLSLNYSIYETTVYYIIHAKFMVNFIIDVP